MQDECEVAATMPITAQAATARNGGRHSKVSPQSFDGGNAGFEAAIARISPVMPLP